MTTATPSADQPPFRIGGTGTALPFRRLQDHDGGSDASYTSADESETIPEEATRRSPLGLLSERLRSLSPRTRLVAGVSGGAVALVCLAFAVWPHHHTNLRGPQEVGIAHQAAMPVVMTPPPTRVIQKAALTQAAPPASAATATKSGNSDLDAMLAMKQPSANPTPHASIPPVATPTDGNTAVARTDTPKADAAQIAGKIVAAPMAPHDQIEVLQLVTEEAKLVQKSREEVANLHDQVRQLQSTTTNKTEDIDRRVSMLEAQKGVQEAAKAPEEQASPADDAARTAKAALDAAMETPKPPVPPARVSVPKPIAPPTPVEWVPRYRILAASPELAMVQDDAAPAGQPTQYEVSVGTVLHGYGRVNAISQRGTLWAIQTEHGLIQ